MKINSVDFVSSLSDSQSICFLNALSCGWYPFGKQFINPNKCCLRNERYKMGGFQPNQFDQKFSKML